MKVAVSVPDRVYKVADRLARRQKKSRSRLYTDALTEYVAHHDPDAITEALNRICDEFGPYPDPAWTAQTRRILERTEW